MIFISIINDYINLVLSSIGLPSVLSIESLKSLLMSLTQWWQIFQPDLIFSIFVYLGCMYVSYFVICILPFRLFKRILKFDKKRGK